MTTLASAMTGRPGLRRSRSAADLCQVVDLPSAEAAWRMLENDAVVTPYGRFGWVSAFATAEDGPVRVAIVRDDDGHPAFMFAATVQTRFGVRIAQPVGGKHANFNIPLLRADWAADLDGAGARRLLRRAGRALGVDAVAIPNNPLVWDGRPNPFAIGGNPSPSPAWSLALEPNGEDTLKRSMSSDARKKLRSKARALGNALGAVRLVRAANPSEVDCMLDGFYAQKEERFRTLGIDDPFAAPAIRQAIRRGACDRAEPAIEIYGLAAGDRYVAFLGGAVDGQRFSGMFLSFDGSEPARFSPGDLVVTEVIREQSALGRTVFDLGVGDARYKRSICDEENPLVDVVVPVNLRGSGFSLARAAFVHAKRRIKASPRMMAAATGARAALRRVRP